jgi:acyl dehydratase
MVDESPKAPWDQRLVERMARQSWEAANDPARARRNPPFREQIKSPYFWVAMLAGVAGLAIFNTVKQGWGYGLGATLYIAGLLVSARARRNSSRG